MAPTPIHKWELPGIPSGFDVHIKRDDMTGCYLSGNKSRKLEFLLADAIQQDCDTVVTIGSLQSNHARITAMAASQVGMKCHLILVTKNTEMKPDDVGCEGNLLLDRLCGAHIALFPTTSLVTNKQYNEAVDKYAAALRCSNPQSKVYSVPVGGMSVVGEWGYIEAFREMIEQGVLENFDDIVLSAGTAGTCGAVAIANYLTGSKLKVHGVTIGPKAENLYQEVNDLLAEYGVHTPEGSLVKASEILDIIEGYIGKAYGCSTEAELVQLIDIAVKTGVALDPDFTAKSVRGLLSELQCNPQRFAGKRILFINTGGTFTLFDGRINSILKAVPESSNVCSYIKIVHESGEAFVNGN
eukprot:Em0017g602a